MVISQLSPDSSAGAGHSLVDFGGYARVSLMLVPSGRGSFDEQLFEVLEMQHQLLAIKTPRMRVTSQTVFLRSETDRVDCQRLLLERYKTDYPATSIVLQPPCCGAALALEVWAIGGDEVSVHYGPHTVRVDYRDTRWTYCGGLQSQNPKLGSYKQTLDVMNQLQTALRAAGSGFDEVVRTWFYLGEITESEGDSQRYKELNRARADFYKTIQFHCSPSQPSIPQGIYPASTGIGMRGTQLVAGCLALNTGVREAFFVSLENPQQTPAYAYHPRYSPQSPKFSRAVALVLGNHVTTWLSGTASVVHSVSRHSGDIQKQTEQTIENMERLISAENFGFHGVKNAGAELSHLAKIRVYLKRAEDFAACKAVCDRRFGPVPAIYAVADVCRPELLVEIEGVAFSRLRGRELQPNNARASR
jgi:enamine deaminase RidA (YjgF/YER057c/UK114 family)